MKSFDKKLVGNATFLFLDWFFVTLLGFIYWSIAGKLLLPNQYGIVSTSVNFAALLSSISLLGLNTTLWKLLPEYLERNQKDKSKELTRFSIKIVIISNIILILGLLFSSALITHILKIPIEAIFIVAITVLILSIGTQFAAVLIGTQDMKKIATTDFIGHFIKILISGALIFLGFNYFGPLLGFMIGMFIMAALRIPFKFLSRVKKEILNKKQIFFEFALPAFISNLALVFFINGQYVLLTAIKNPEATGLFTIAVLLTSPILSVPNVLSSALFPIISQLSANRGSKERQKHLINMVLRYSLFFSVPAAMLLIIFSKNLILFFSRSEYLPSSSLFPILALASIIYGVGLIFNQVLYSLGKPKIQRNIILMTVLLFFILAIPLTILFSNFGMCIAFLLSVSFFSFTSYKNTKKILNIHLPWESVMKIFLSALFSLLFLFVIACSVSGILEAIVFCILAGMIYLEFLFLIKFYTKQDIVILKSIIEKSPLFKRQFMSFIDFVSRFI
jgi:O-antigen/teichoic acid export membrane protein